MIFWIDEFSFLNILNLRILWIFRENLYHASRWMMTIESFWLLLLWYQLPWCCLSSYWCVVYVAIDVVEKPKSRLLELTQMPVVSISSWCSLIRHSTIRQALVFDQIESHRPISSRNSHKRSSIIRHSIIENPILLENQIREHQLYLIIYVLHFSGQFKCLFYDHIYKNYINCWPKRRWG